MASPKTIPREQWERVRRGEISETRLARELRMTRATLKNIVRREGWPDREGSAPTTVPMATEADAKIRALTRRKILRMEFLAHNRTQSHQQVLRIVQKVRCNLESYVDGHAETGYAMHPKTCKLVLHALAWAERIEADRQALIATVGEKKVAFALIEKHITEAPPPLGETSATLRLEDHGDDDDDQGEPA